MKLSLIPLVLAMVLGACGKTSDLPALQEEAQGLTARFDQQLGDLEQRADAIIRRGNAVGPTSPDAQHAIQLFNAAKARLDEMRNLVSSAKAKISSTKDTMEMRKLFDSMQARLEKQWIEVNADFGTVESWLWLAEARQGTPPAPAPTPPPAPTPEDTTAPATPPT